jgi:23S rRNA G2069 N7-methylase RlmK/C1962 C5-methylase RlmI
MANRQQCIALISRIEGNDWNEFKGLVIDQAESKLILQLLNKWKRESDRHMQEYAENTDYYKKVNSDRYYAKKEKINQSRKKKYQVSKVEVFRK